MSDLTYLASPYSKYPGGRERAYEMACVKAAHLMEAGRNVFCPISHSHVIETMGMPGKIQNGDWWLKQDFAVLSKCTELLVYCLDGWKESYGVQKEIKFAQDHGIPVGYVF